MKWPGQAKREGQSPATRLEIPCRSHEDLPSPKHLLRVVTRNQYVALVFPAEAVTELGRESIVDRLSQQLPALTVTKGGLSPRDQTGYIFIKRLISEEDTLANADAIVGAATQFRDVATNLCHEMAALLSIDHRDLLPWTMTVHRIAQTGSLNADWRYFFHGFECKYVQRTTGSVLDVRLEFAPEFGVLSAGFFFNFLETTPTLRHMTTLLTHKDYDLDRALDVLHRHGLLDRVDAPSNFGEGYGYLAPKRDVAREYVTRPLS